MNAIMLSNKTDGEFFELLREVVWNSDEFYTESGNCESFSFWWREADIVAGQVRVTRLTEAAVALELEENLDPVKTGADFMYFLSASMDRAEALAKTQSGKGLTIQRVSPSVINHPKVKEALKNKVIVTG